MTEATNCCVLLIEDEPGDASLVRQYLRASTNLRFELIWRENLADGEQIIAQQKIDVVLVDLSLPDSRGLDTVRRIRKATRVLPIIVLTGHDDTEFSLKALDCGAQDYLIKASIDTDSLVRAIRYALTRISLEKRLYESEQRMGMALQSASLGLWDWHIPSGKVIFNELWASILGYTLDEVGSDIDIWKRLVHPDDWQVVKASLDPHLRGETDLYSAEHRLLHKQGHWVWVHDTGRVLEWDFHGQPIRAVGIHQDISLRKASELRDHLLVSALETVEHGVVITDVNANIEWANKAFETLTGFSRHEAIGMRPNELVKSGKQDPTFYQNLWDTILSGNTWRGEIVNRRKNGELYDEELVISPVKDQQGCIRHFVGVKQDVSERKRIQSELWELATTDGLTGFLNRRHFMARLENEFARVQRNNHRVAVLMLDLDHFKQINDGYGHPTGDAMLQHFAGIIRAELRKIDVVGRIGGEEFAIFMPETDAEPAIIIAERLRNVLADTPLVIDKHTISITVSIGIALMHADSGTADCVLTKADKALYTAKENGRNSVRVWL
ncbi:diguanylate cyclase [Methylomonas rosea]|uniref:Diguanylate cyclase n=1 Tax=Methylomonas rosea TaxID=2952227 RepID=A0ABT1TV70_9GAMM|nr:diguanylate cyclase [Methylomonas sp. WSC-7]MCQ8118677.1 diguanylate cyclase [Methylomonas sp. WSC-7]